MIILTIKEHTFKSEEPFGIASKFLEESDFNDLDIENNYQLPIVGTYPNNWIFENDLTVRFYKVISKGDEKNRTCATCRCAEFLDDCKDYPRCLVSSEGFPDYLCKINCEDWK